MKDYSLRLEDSKTFVLNYTIKDNRIVIHFASKEICDIPYTLENEKRVLQKMKQQVLESSNFREKQEKRISNARDTILYSIMTFTTSCVVSINYHPYITLLFSSLFGIVLASSVYTIVDGKRKINDVDKNMMFLDNEKRLNQVVKVNQNNLSRKTKKLIENTIEQPAFTLNSIHKMKYKELKEILENMKREELFNADSFLSSTDNPVIFTKSEKKN